MRSNYRKESNMQQEQDYLMKIIHQLIEILLGDILRGKEKVSEAQTQRYIELKMMVDNYEINEAENLIFDHLDTENIKDFELALKFYQYINEKDDEFLEKARYTREEIEQGIRDISKKYGYENMVDLFLR